MRTQIPVQSSHITGGYKAALSREATLPANAYHMNGRAVIHEGIQLQINHPLVPNEPALIIGEFYVRRAVNGCFYNEDGDTATVRRLKVITSGNQNKTLFLGQVSWNNEGHMPLYLAVDAHVEFNPGATVKFDGKFWCGVTCTGAKPLVTGHTESFINFEKDGDAAVVFYTDGRVKRVVRKNDALTIVSLTPEQTAEARINQILDMIEYLRNSNLNDDSKAKRVDKFYHYLCNILEIGGVKSDTIFEQAYCILEAAAADGMLHKNVQYRVADILRKSFPAYAFKFQDVCDSFLEGRARTDLKMNGSGFSAPSQPARKGVPAKRAAKLADRRSRDREARGLSRGSNVAKPLHAQGNNKGSKEK